MSRLLYGCNERVTNEFIVCLFELDLINQNTYWDTCYDVETYYGVGSQKRSKWRMVRY